VVSEERYSALLESGEFDADGASADAAMAVITSGSIGAQRAAADPRPERKWTFIALVSGIALLLVALGAWLLRRANRARRRPAGRQGEGARVDATGTVVFDHDKAAPAPRPGPPVDPSSPGSTRFEPLAETSTAGGARSVCPACGTLYEDASLEACPRDGARLLPVNA
jgi:hypothetical protein